MSGIRRTSGIKLFGILAVAILLLPLLAACVAPAAPAPAAAPAATSVSAAPARYHRAGRPCQGQGAEDGPHRRAVQPLHPLAD